MREHVVQRGFVSILLLVGLLAVLSLAPGCKPTASTDVDAQPEAADSVVPEELSTADAAAIFELVVRQVCGPDDTFGGKLDPPVAYIVRRAGGVSMGPDARESEPKSIPDSLQEAISARLADAAFDVEWVDSSYDVQRDSDGSVVGGGVIVTLGVLVIQENGSVEVSGQTYIANLAAGLRTYVIGLVDGAWTIIGTVGPTVIS